MTQSISGLGSGLDTNSIISQLVALERRSQTLAKGRGTSAQTALASYTAIRSQLSSLRNAASALLRPADWRPLSATSSNSDAVAVSAGNGSFGGSIAFTVDALAKAGSHRSVNTLASTATAVVLSNTGIMVASGGAKLGIYSLASDDAMQVGSYDITVTQSSAAATKTGSALGATTTIDGTNDTLNVTVNGAAIALTLAQGTYTRAELATVVQAAADAAGAAVNVRVDEATDAIAITTSREGSAATLQVTGGSGLTALGLATDGAALTGTDGKIKVGSASEQTLTSIEGGTAAVLPGPSASVTAVFSGGLRVGTITAKNVSTGDGSLGAVVANINAANAGVTAAAVLVGNGKYRLQISSNTAGAQNDVNLAASEFNANVNGFVALTQASDAQLTVGTGPGAYTISSATNTVSGFLPGVTVTLKQETTSAVTVSATRDVSALATKLSKLVDAYNQVKSTLDKATYYDTATKQGGALVGDSVARRIVSTLSRALSDAVPWTSPKIPSLAGLSADKSGKYSFDEAKFTAAYNDDPEAMAKVFTQGGAAADATVSFVYAGDRARAGTYTVNIVNAAEQASATVQSTWLGGGAAIPLKIRVGSTEITQTIATNTPPASVVSALNEKFAAAGLGLEAVDSPLGVEIRSSQYGAGATFDIDTGSGYTTMTGTDVVGLINGVVATGKGQQLSAPYDDTTVGGLTLQIDPVNGSGWETTFTYQPGVAQRVQTALLDATDSISGYITARENALKSRTKFIDTQVASMESRLVAYEKRLKQQFSGLEATMGTLRQQSNWLAGQVASLGGNSG